MKAKLFSLMLILATTVCITSCSSDDGDGQAPATLDKTIITLYVDESSTITYSGGKCEWSSDNDLVAEVENGIVTAKHVGTTTIHANNLVCSVIVKPKYTTYVEPYTDWGASISTIKSKMSGYTFKGTSESETLGQMYTYEGKGKVQAYVYGFKNGELTSSCLYVSLLNSTNLSDFLLERYIVIDISEKAKNDYMIYMLTVDMKTLVVMNLSTSGALVLYSPAPEDGTRTADSDWMKQKLMEVASLCIMPNEK